MANHRGLFPTVLSLVVALLVVPACSSAPDTADEELGEQYSPITTEETEDGLLAEYLDTNNDGNPDIIRYFEQYEDPQQDNRTRRRLRVMEIDVNRDSVINVRREYDDYGNVTREENDQNLDGTMDVTLYFVGGELARKEYQHASGNFVEERRVYLDGQLVRVERDQTGDGEPNRWEYYEDGVLMRIGRDTTGDGSADTWQLR